MNSNENNKTRRFNTVVELDQYTDSCYIFVPPFSHRTNHKVDKNQQIESKFGIIAMDFSGGQLCGIEITEASKMMDISALRQNKR